MLAKEQMLNDTFLPVQSMFTAVMEASTDAVNSLLSIMWKNFTILRYGSLYGPRSDHRNGLWRIVKHALESETISYVGSPEAMREYIHVEDAARASVTALNEDFCNQHVVLTGQEPMRVYDLLKMIGEILGRPNSVKFVKEKNEAHYVRTPYAYQPEPGRKYVPQMHVDLGQGLLQLIEEVQKSSSAETFDK